jgi:hypothetical protein
MWVEQKTQKADLEYTAKQNLGTHYHAMAIEDAQLRLLPQWQVLPGHWTKSLIQGPSHK